MNRKNIGVIIITAALLLLWPIAHIGTAYAFNGYLEDCDFDGYDDADGVTPVPWYGFDQTRGDKIPADWDGKAGSYSQKHEDSLKGDTPTSGSSSSEKTPATDSSKASSGVSGTSGKSGGTSGGSGASEVSGSSGGSGTSTTSGSSSRSGTSAGSGASSTGALASGGSDVSASSGASNGSGTSADSVASSGSGASVDSGTPAPADSQKTAEEVAVAALAEEIKSVVSVKGVLDIAVGAKEKAFRSGGIIAIKGTGFAANAKGLTVEIRSDPQVIGSVSTGADGSFELSTAIPDGLSFGKHDIVLLYKGEPIIKKTIELATPVEAKEKAERGIPSNVLIGGAVLIALFILVAFGFLGRRILWRAAMTGRSE